MLGCEREVPKMNIHKNKCSCWFDGWFGKSWAEFCEKHDKRYMTPLGKGMTRWECDIELAEGVSSVCVVMAVIMFIGVRCAGWYWWNEFKAARLG